MVHLLLKEPTEFDDGEPVHEIGDVHQCFCIEAFESMTGMTMSLGECRRMIVTFDDETITLVHKCPPLGESITPCCHKLVFELPRYSRMTLNDDKVTCNKSDDKG